MKTIEMQVSQLEVCDRTRVRKRAPKEASDVIDEYTEGYRCGLIVEPLDVFQERGTERYIVADGEHRLLALKRAKIKTIEVRLHEGDEVAAFDFAVDCNQKHGVRRTREDKYHAFERIMELEPLREKYRTDTQLSEKLGVHKNTVANYKVQWRNSESDDKSTRRKKDEAKQVAERHTNKDLEPRKALNGKTHHIEAPAPKVETAKLADDGWTKADETGHEAILDALAEFAKVVTKQTRPAQIQARDTVLKTVRELFA